MPDRENLFDLSNRTAIVTGGTGAIGSEMSRTLLKAGARVAIWGRTPESVSAVSTELESTTGGKCIGVRVDAGSETEVRQAFSETVKTLGDVQILINCAGGNIGKCSLIDTDMEQFREVLEMNLVAGLMVPTKVVAADWIEKQINGSVINLASMTSYKPLSGVWAYDAAKAGVLNLTRAAAKELAPHRIRVNAIAPGFFVGKQNRDLLYKQGSEELTKRGEAIISRTPFKRFGLIKELAGATLFLACESASGFVTGVSIPVDGGFLVDNI